MAKIAIITGASSGIGKETASILARRFEVEEIWLVARRENRLRDLAAEISVHATPRCFALDLAKADAVDTIIEAIREEHADITWLVNAAGFGNLGQVSTIPADAQLSMLDVNCRALTALCAKALPFMEKGAHIVNFASAAAFLPQPGFAVYAATKSYVLSFSRALARELSARGIVVTAVCPGPVETEFFDIAEKTGQIKLYKKLIMADCQKVCQGTVLAAEKGKEVYVPTFTMKAFRLLCAMPHSLLLRFVK